MLRALVRLACCAALLVGAAAHARAREAFSVPEEQVRQRIHTVALRPPRIQLPYDVPAPAVLAHTAALQHELERAGLRVVPAGVYARAWIEVAARLGGVYDPVTGEPDAAKWKLAREHTLRELSREVDVDGVLDWGYFEAPIWDLTGDPPVWRAAGEDLTLDGNKLPVYRAGIGANRVLGVWVWVTLSDRADAEIFDRAIALSWTALRHGARQEHRSIDEIFGPSAERRVVRVLADLVAAFRRAPATAAGAGTP